MEKRIIRKLQYPRRGADRGRRRVCCENPIRPRAGESFYDTSNVRGHNGKKNNKKTSIPIRPMLW